MWSPNPTFSVIRMGTRWVNLFKNHNIFSLALIFFLVMTVTFDQVVTNQGET